MHVSLGERKIVVQNAGDLIDRLLDLFRCEDLGGVSPDLETIVGYPVESLQMV